MNKTAIIAKASGLVGKATLQLKKHSPEILVVAGVVGFVGSTILACKATTKVSTILENSKKNIDTIHECADDIEFCERENYTPEDAKKDLTIVYAQTGWELTKLYAPAVILGVLSATAVLASNNIMRKRNVALAAAYTAVDKSFKEYQNRVIERFGEDVNRELKYNIKAKKVEETVTDEETGKKKKTKKTVNVTDGNFCSPYARVFDCGSRCWEKDPESNLYFLRAEQEHFTNKLRSRGYLTLNEVYERLDIPVTKAGQIVGWVYDPEDPNLHNYVDLGIYDITREKVRDFINGYEENILLDPNVDGDILDLIPKYQK